MDKKVTIKDVARAAGVSVATVSYVINERTDKRISEETRKHVMHIANMLNFSCNFVARFISTGRSYIIALYTGKCSFPIHKAEQFDFMLMLVKVLESRGFSLRFIPNDNLSQLHNVDAIVCYDTTTEHFRTVGNNNFVPLIAVNALIDDLLFFQVNDDFKNIKAFAQDHFGKNFAVVSCNFINDRLREDVGKNFPDITFVDNFESLDSFCKAHTDTPVLALGRHLYEYCKEYCHNIITYDTLKEVKADKLIECVELAIKREENVVHNIKI